MMKKILNFIQYHNAFTIMLMMLFGGVSMTFAASPNARQAVFAEKQVVRSVDNSYLVKLDLSRYDMSLKIDRISEDDTYYYVDFSYNELEVIDYVWRDALIHKSFKIARSDVGGKDLGLFLAEQLGQIVNGRMAYYKEVQTKEKGRGLSLKVITTEYSGLIGKFLDPKEEEFPGYTPVIPEPVPPPPPVAIVYPKNPDRPEPALEPQPEQAQAPEPQPEPTSVPESAHEQPAPVPDMIPEPQPIVDPTPGPSESANNNSASLIQAVQPQVPIPTPEPVPSVQPPVQESASAVTLVDTTPATTTQPAVSGVEPPLSQDPESIRRMVDEALANMQNASSTIFGASTTTESIITPAESVEPQPLQMVDEPTPAPELIVTPEAPVASPAELVPVISEPILETASVPDSPLAPASEPPPTVDEPIVEVAPVVSEPAPVVDISTTTQ